MPGSSSPLLQRVLVVEDDDGIQGILRRYLERAGLAVLVATTGTEALAELERSLPDLVLLDLGLPDIDGSEVLRVAAPTTPVVVLTARAGVVDRIEALAAGADDYVAKPFSPTEVVLRVQALLARSQPHGPPARPDRGGASAAGGQREARS